ncbi:MAG TPA: PDDEXK nuclease domain-containing protein [Saprospiraceae bacterium]|nr:PDDEXK nuclease domain-containing protein [Saprospiraceae bacterium]
MSKEIAHPAQPVFDELLQHIQQARSKAFRQANTVLIDLYWRVGKTISEKVQTEVWGKGVVAELARYIARQAPDIRGFSDKNLWRMKQFYETYREDEKLATLWRELSWSHNRLIMTCKHPEERAFYLQLSVQEKWSVRALERQINTAQFERTLLEGPKLSPLLRVLHPDAMQVFKDNYILEFLGLPDMHSENDLQKALVQHMKQFILELGPDFIFMGEQYRLQVGNQDFYLDLLFYHRGLSALVAFELKIGKFSPKHLGQLNFYLEALDRDVKKPHENPSIGVLLCRDKDEEVVEYALSRNLSPALIAQYQLQLPDKKIIQAKLHEWMQQLPDMNTTQNNNA